MTALFRSDEALVCDFSVDVDADGLGWDVKEVIVKPQLG